MRDLWNYKLCYAAPQFKIFQWLLISLRRNIDPQQTYITRRGLVPCLCSDVLFCHFTSPHLMHSSHSDLTISQTCQYHFYNEVIIWMFSFGIISGFSNPCCPTLFIIFAWFSPFLQVLAANIILSNELSLMNLSKCNTPMPHPWHSLSFYCALFLWETLHESRSFDPFLCCCIFFISCTKSSG